MAEELTSLRLRPGSAKPLYAGHPWVFASAIAGREGPAADSGDEVRVLDPHGKVLGHGYYSPRSAIAVRLLTRGDTPADEALLRSRLREALALRRDVLALGPSTSAYRLVHSEGDGLGGLIVDVYGEYLAVAFGTHGMSRRRETILDALQELLRPRGVMDKSSPQVCEREELPAPARHVLRGEVPAEHIEVLEDGIPFLVDLRRGQKTGLYLDQRENRRRIAGWARGRDVLDAFSYTGAFSLHGARAGARSLTLLDASAPALELARRNLERNSVVGAELICSDWSSGLRGLREKNRSFDLLILDPPKFAPNQASVPQALAGYRELNAHAARLLRPGGLLCTCSCSGNVTAEEFERVVAQGLSDAGCRAALLERRGAAPDHPVPPGFEQGSYLKCLILVSQA